MLAALTPADTAVLALVYQDTIRVHRARHAHRHQCGSATHRASAQDLAAPGAILTARVRLAALLPLLAGTEFAPDQRACQPVHLIAALAVAKHAEMVFAEAVKL